MRDPSMCANRSPLLGDRSARGLSPCIIHLGYRYATISSRGHRSSPLATAEKTAHGDQSEAALRSAGCKVPMALQDNDGW